MPWPTPVGLMGLAPLNRSRIVQWSILAVAAGCLAAPLTPILVQAFADRPLYAADYAFTLDNLVRLAAAEDFLTIVWNTLALAVITAAVAQVIGATTAILVCRTNLPGRGIFGVILIWPFFVSSLVIGFGWFAIYGPAGFVTLAVQSVVGTQPWDLYTVAGMGLVAGSAQAPLTYLICIAALTRADARLEDAARLSGASPLGTLWHVTLPLLRPALLMSGILNVVGGLDMLAIPLLFGGPTGFETLTTYLYRNGLGIATRPDYGLVSSAALVLLAIVILLVWLERRLSAHSGRFVTVRGKAARPAVLDLGPWRWLAFAAVATYAVFAVVLVIGGVFLRSAVSFLTPLIPFWELFTWGNYDLVFGQAGYRRAIMNSVLIATLGAAVGVTLVAAMAFVARRSDFALRRSLEYIALFPRTVPGLVIGLGMFYTVVWLPPLEAVRGTLVVMAAAFIIRHAPVGFAAIAPAFAQIDRDLDRSARLAGADWLETNLRVVLPLLRPALLSAFVLMFIHFIQEYPTAVFLFQPGSEVMGLAMLQLWANGGSSGPVAALATIQVAITTLVVILARRILKVRLHG